MDKKKFMWEILVPTVSNRGQPFKTRQHKVWDEKIRILIGGVTVMSPIIKGEWTSPSGEVFAERMIPVKVYCTEPEIKIIAEFTKNFYNQKAVMCYVISEKVIIFE